MQAVGALLARAQSSGAVRADVQVGDVFSLVNGVHAAIGAHERDAKSRARLISVIFDGLRGTSPRIEAAPKKNAPRRGRSPGKSA